MRRAPTSSVTGKVREPRSVLGDLLVVVRTAVARLELEAVRTQTDKAVAGWSLALGCARELALVAEAIGALPTELAARRLGPSPLEGLTHAYERALMQDLPRSVRGILALHLARLRQAGSPSKALRPAA